MANKASNAQASRHDFRLRRCSQMATTEPAATQMALIVSSATAFLADLSAAIGSISKAYPSTPKSP